MFNLKPKICQSKLKKEKSHLLLMRPISSVRINKCKKDIPWKQQTKESISVIRVYFKYEVSRNKEACIIMITVSTKDETKH